ncbi:hypothetical protein [Nocardioides sp. W7]|uniref:hypothetical protein n=1 Tax=Nocardioides sp. W7 TaxID=2931390 RepID=UPI001FD34A80|nr:hypothetical protein [Nocardioides sp. W7]
MTDPQHPAVLAPLRLDRGLRILEVELIENTGVVESYDFSKTPMTVIAGEPNSSKTTTLRVIDYCLGQEKSPAAALGSAIEEKYSAVAITIAINGDKHRLAREFAQGLKSKVTIDDHFPIDASDLSPWLMGKLGWPLLEVPLGRNPLTATQKVPLTFRSPLRHMYRREDSWTEFATKERQYLRSAVISLFLGFAPNRYETAEFELGEAQRALAAAHAVHRNVAESTHTVVADLSKQLGLPPILNAASIDRVRDQLAATLRQTEGQRDGISELARRAVDGDGAPGLDRELPARLAAASQQVDQTTSRTSQLAVLLEEFGVSLRSARGEIERLQRLSDSVDVFGDLPVRLCPACEQKIDTRHQHASDDCYLCHQPVTDDRRQRRAAREIRALETEIEDLSHAIERTAVDLEQARAAEREAKALREDLAAELHDERFVLLAPFVGPLQDTSSQIGRLQQQLAALPALEAILLREENASNAVDDALAEVTRLEELATQETTARSDAQRNCSALADRMNEFLVAFNGRGWIGQQVTIAADDLTFYVGTRPWDESLGAEAKVLFFLAYSYGLVRLSGANDPSFCVPGLVILDNPHQHGLGPAIVADAISRIGNEAVRLGAQVIVTQVGHSESITAPHSVVRMPRIYAADPSPRG